MLLKKEYCTEEMEMMFSSDIVFRLICGSVRIAARERTSTGV